MFESLVNEQRIHNEDEAVCCIGKMLFPNDEDRHALWVLKRYFRVMSARHLDCSVEADGEYDSYIYQIVGAQLGGMIYKLGGWEKILRLMTQKSPELRQMTMEPAGRGLIAGKVLLEILENGGNISEACAAVGERDLSIITRDTWEGQKTHFPSDAEHIRKNYWYEFRSVAHLWAAAWDFFDDQFYFVETVCWEQDPFNRKLELPEPVQAFKLFLEKSIELYGKAQDLSPSWKKIIPGEPLG